MIIPDDFKMCNLLLLSRVTLLFLLITLLLFLKICTVAVIFFRLGQLYIGDIAFLQSLNKIFVHLYKNLVIALHSCYFKQANKSYLLNMCSIISLCFDN